MPPPVGDHKEPTKLPVCCTSGSQVTLEDTRHLQVGGRNDERDPPVSLAPRTQIPD